MGVETDESVCELINSIFFPFSVTVQRTEVTKSHNPHINHGRHQEEDAVSQI